MKYRWMGVVVLALIVSLGLTGCGTFGKIFGGIGGIFSPNRHNDFAENNIRLRAEQLEYTKHRLVVVDEAGDVRDGILTKQQYAIFQALEQNVIDADNVLHEDVLEWRRTSTRPVSFTGKSDTLSKAQKALIAFVQKEAVKP